MRKRWGRGSTLVVVLTGLGVISTACSSESSSGSSGGATAKPKGYVACYRAYINKYQQSCTTNSDCGAQSRLSCVDLSAFGQVNALRCSGYPCKADSDCTAFDDLCDQDSSDPFVSRCGKPFGFQECIVDQPR